MNPNENETETTRDALPPPARRSVVFRRYEAIETWFVEADSAAAARERVFPAAPEHHSQVSTHLARIEEKGIKPTRAAERAMTLLRSPPSGSMIRAIQIQAPRREKPAE